MCSQGSTGELRNRALRMAASLAEVPHGLCPTNPSSLGRKSGPSDSSWILQGSHRPHWTAGPSRAVHGIKRKLRAQSQSPREPGLLGAADMEGQSDSGSRRPGTRAGLGPLPVPVPHGVSQTGAPSKVRPLKPSPSSLILGPTHPHAPQALWCPWLRGGYSPLPLAGARYTGHSGG